MNTIVFPEEVQGNYRAILANTYYYSSNSALKLEDKLEFYLTQLQIHNKFCPVLLKFKGLHRCRITKNISMVYRTPKPNRVLIIAFFDNRMKNDFL